MSYHSMKEEHNLFMCVRISSSTIAVEAKKHFNDVIHPFIFLSTLIYESTYRYESLVVKRL